MRWRDLARHTGAPSSVIARALDITPRRWAKLVLGLDRGEDLLERASAEFRVTECWLRGHVPELPEKVAGLLDRVDATTGDADELKKTLSAWATCAECEEKTE